MKLKKETLQIIYAVISIVVIVSVPLLYSNIYDKLLYKTFDNAFVSARVIAISPSYVSGIIKKIYVKGGDSIKKGQLIVLIDDTLYRADLAKSQARLNALKFRLNQMKSQFGKDDVKYMDIEKEAEIFEAYVKSAKLMLSYTRIVSPINGIVAKDVLHTGDSVSPSDIIMYVYDPATLYIKAYVSTKYIGYFNQDMIIGIKIGKHTLKGKVTKIGGVDVFNVCNRNAPAVPIKIIVDKKYFKYLKFGMPVKLIVK